MLRCPCCQEELSVAGDAGCCYRVPRIRVRPAPLWLVALVAVTGPLVVVPVGVRLVLEPPTATPPVPFRERYRDDTDKRANERRAFEVVALVRGREVDATAVADETAHGYRFTCVTQKAPGWFIFSAEPLVPGLTGDLSFTATPDEIRCVRANADARSRPPSAPCGTPWLEEPPHTSAKRANEAFAFETFARVCRGEDATVEVLSGSLHGYRFSAGSWSCAVPADAGVTGDLEFWTDGLAITCREYRSPAMGTMVPTGK